MLPIKKKDFLKSIRNLLVSSSVIACSVTHAMEREEDLQPQPQLQHPWKHFLNYGGVSEQQIQEDLQLITDPKYQDHDPKLILIINVSNCNDLTSLKILTAPSDHMLSLQRLNLINCYINNIEHIAFMNLPNLTHLNLNNNVIVGYKPFAKCNFQKPMELYLNDRGPEKAPCSLVRTKIPHFLGVPQMDRYANPKFYYEQLDFIRIMTSIRWDLHDKPPLPEEYTTRQFIEDHKNSRLG